MDRKLLRRWIRRVWVTLGVGFTTWLVWNMQAHGVPASVIVATDRVQVQNDRGTTVFFPAGARPDEAGLVFLPGGGVDPTAYLPIVRRIADAGSHAALVRLPYRAAATDASRDEVWQRILRVREKWGMARPFVLAGHSRGGALAARFAEAHAREINGLVLIGTTHPRDHDLSRVTFPVLKIMGTSDCVAPLDDARANAKRLPAKTQWVEVQGGNHAQFGYYGSQFNDCNAAISREEQQRQLHVALLSMIERTSR